MIPNFYANSEFLQPLNLGEGVMKQRWEGDEGLTSVGQIEILHPYITNYPELLDNADDLLQPITLDRI